MLTQLAIYIVLYGLQSYVGIVEIEYIDPYKSLKLSKEEDRIVIEILTALQIPCPLAFETSLACLSHEHAI